ncbi:MAG: hypothetical protein ACJ72N_07395 [Labedaea sp.]
MTERSRFGYTPPAESDEPVPVAVAASEPEAATLVSETLGSPTIPLAGDLFAALTKRIGADRAVKYVSDKLGVDCHCEERRRKANELDAKVRRFLGW